MPKQSAMTNAVIITNEMRKKAIELMPAAQSSAEAEEIRYSFFKASRAWLKVQGCESFSEAKITAKKAQKRLKSIFMIAQGVVAKDGHIITIDCWEEILAHFNQEPTSLRLHQ
jgi:hypothetical protein